MSTDADRRTAAWIAQRMAAWRQLETRLEDAADGRRAEPDVVLGVVRSYPELARDLAVARRTAPDSALARRLAHDYARLHRGLFHPAGSFKHDLATLFRPRTCQPSPASCGIESWGVAIGLCLAAGSGWWLVATYPELARLFASEEMIETVQRGKLWTDGILNISPSSVLSVAIFTNNIVVALMAFCLGCVYGLGTIYIIALNGAMIGSLFAFTAQHGPGGGSCSRSSPPTVSWS